MENRSQTVSLEDYFDLIYHTLSEPPLVSIQRGDVSCIVTENHVGSVPRLIRKSRKDNGPEVECVSLQATENDTHSPCLTVQEVDLSMNNR